MRATGMVMIIILAAVFLNFVLGFMGVTQQLISGIDALGWTPTQTIFGPDASGDSTLDRNRDHHYWTFYSTGPDGADNTQDDILSPADRIQGYYLTPTVLTPIP